MPRLLLALPSRNGKNNNDKNNPTNAQGLTGHSISDLLLSTQTKYQKKRA
jgi:hypothetical protein